MLITQRPTLSEETASEYRSRLIVEPLEPDFGYTLGNSMHRTLLSSIPGAAVTSIKIEGGQHEFFTLEDVVEDVTKIILNLKSLVLSSGEGKPVVMYLHKAGADEVTAADIQPPVGVEVHNSELHTTTLSEGGKLEMELVVERGRSHVSSVLSKNPDVEIGRIPVDSIYSLVLKVSYKVEATRVAQRTDFDRLIIDVETKPSMASRGVVASMGWTLVGFFGLTRELDVNAEGIKTGLLLVDEQTAESLNLPVEDLNFPVRPYNYLKREGIRTVGELVTRSEEDLLDIRSFGSKSILEVKVILHNLGLALRDVAPGFGPIQAIERYDQEHEGEEDIDTETGDDYAETEQC